MGSLPLTWTERLANAVGIAACCAGLAWNLWHLFEPRWMIERKRRRRRVVP